MFLVRGDIFMGRKRKFSALGYKTPMVAYQSESKALRFLAPETITNAFLHCEERKDDKAGCISFINKK